MPVPDTSGRLPVARGHEEAGSVIVCSADAGTGKTSWCLQLARAAEARALSVSGVATPAEREGAARRWVQDLRSGERRLLGREDPDGSSHPETPRWKLFDDALGWGDDRLRQSCPTDVLVVDELGPVELIHHRGWLAGARAALRGEWRLAVVTVRPLLLEALLPELGGRPWTVLTADSTGWFPQPEAVLDRELREMFSPPVPSGIRPC